MSIPQLEANYNLLRIHPILRCFYHPRKQTESQKLSHFVTRAPYAGASAQLPLLLENSKIIMSKKILRVTCATGTGSSFDS